ncbi:MAG: type II toxin-antitoxin system VapC family toxin [Melioribacteraceae bacterium]|nr:type II toxin-antitoxin system VapC family toxin [Melioribacteraceae bacterium]
MKIYADTSVFGGMFDKEFLEASKRFFNEIDSERFVLVTSAIVEAELEPAPKVVKDFFSKYAKIANVVEINEDALHLQKSYISSRVVTKKSMQDALHVAIATVSGCEIIVSWNFKHIVHFDKIPKYNAVNILNGYSKIGIYSPLEVISYDNP